jgi:hypothetical protein
MKIIFTFLEDLFKNIPNFFWNIYKNKITNIVKKQAGVVHVILFAFASQRLLSQILLF